jgi:hypothetical protein
MEVRTVLVSLLSRFWFDLAPSMAKPETVRRNQQIALTLKIKGGLQLTCRPHASMEAAAGGGGGGGAKAPARRGAGGGGDGSPRDRSPAGPAN